MSKLEASTRPELSALAITPSQRPYYSRFLSITLGFLCLVLVATFLGSIPGDMPFFAVAHSFALLSFTMDVTGAIAFSLFGIYLWVCSTTAPNYQALHQRSWRLGLAASLFQILYYVCALFYLFEPLPDYEQLNHVAREQVIKGASKLANTHAISSGLDLINLVIAYLLALLPLIMLAVTMYKIRRHARCETL